MKLNNKKSPMCEALKTESEQCQNFQQAFKTLGELLWFLTTIKMKQKK